MVPALWIHCNWPRTAMIASRGQIANRIDSTSAMNALPLGTIVLLGSTAIGVPAMRCGVTFSV